MKQERLRRSAHGRKQEGDQDAPQGRQEVRKDIRATWWPEG